MWYWVKIMLLALLALFQMACPKYATTSSENPTTPSSQEQGGSGTG